MLTTASFPIRLRHQNTGDFEEQAALLSGWNQDYRQISAGPFQGYLSDVHLPDVHLFMEYTNRSLYQSGQLEEDVVAIGIPLNQRNSVFCGVRTHKGHVHIYSGQNGFEFISGMDMLVGVIAVKREALLATLSPQDAEHVLPLLREAQILGISHQAWDRLSHFFQASFDLLRFKPQLAESPAFVQMLRHAGLIAVGDSLLDRVSHTAPSFSTRNWQTVSIARELMHHGDEPPLSVADLAKQLGMSRRNLQYHFETLLEMSPLEFLRAERLNGVRRMLKTSNSVTEAAAHWGFWHFGHFSQEYKKMFGELPSATFKRMHN